MIEAGFLTLSTGSIVGVTVQGHSGQAEYGRDILCAAVSSAVYLVFNTVTDVLSLKPKALRAEDGDAYLLLNEDDAKLCEAILKGLLIHLKELSRQYPNELSVNPVKIENPVE